MSAKSTIKAGALRPLKNSVFVTEIEAGPRISKGGLILPDDNMKESGIRDRWARVHAVGPEVTDVEPGDWVLVQHGRWTLGIAMQIAGENVTLWRIDYPEAVLLASPTDPRSAKNHSFA